MSTQRKLLLVVAALLSAAICVGAGVVAGYTIGQQVPERITITGVEHMSPTDGSSVDFSLFWKTWHLIDTKHYRSEDANGQQRMYGAIKGLVQSLNDPYSEFFSPSETKQFNENIQGAFGGIGIEIGMRNGHLVVIAPIKDTPADKAGIKAGDFVVEIDGISTERMSIDDAVVKIRGPVGSQIKLTTFREGAQKPQTLTLQRATISVPTLDFTMKGDIAYVQLYEFTGTASDLFRTKVVDVLPKNTKGIVIDLRNNPGGYLETAVDIASYFVQPGVVVVKEEGRANGSESLSAHGPGTLATMPVVLLINKGSASASEILAGALHDIRGARLVGEQSFGKGVVQEVQRLPGGASVKLTVAEWILPNGGTINKTGLKPDVELRQPENLKKGEDPQLEKALELLR